MRHDLREVLGLQRVEHVEEILSGWALALGEFVREEGHEVRVLLEHREQVLDGELLVVGHGDLLDLGLLEELLPARQHRLEKVFGDDRLVREVELEAAEG